MSEGELARGLDELVASGLASRRGASSEVTYAFKHSLVQDAVYDTLLKSRRRELHARIAGALRERFFDFAEQQPEVLAHHLTEAGETDSAIEWWGKAGDAALRRSAFQEAIAHLGKAIEMADREGAPKRQEAPARADVEAQTLLAQLAGHGEKVPAKRQSRAALQANYARALMLGKGFARPETSAAAARARESSGASSRARFEAMFVDWGTQLVAGGIAAANEIAETFVSEAEAHGQASERRTGLRVVGTLRLYQGRLSEAEAAFRHNLPSSEAALAEAELAAQQYDAALATADRALAFADASGVAYGPSGWV